MTPDRAPSFERDIRPLFREKDREEMEFVLDLWAYDDVRNDAANILERVADGTMPCDVAWDEATIQTFRDWIAGDFQP